jgi:hypothetical protein
LIARAKQLSASHNELSLWRGSGARALRASLLALALLPGAVASPGFAAPPDADPDPTLFDVELRLRWNQGGGAASGTVLEATGPSGRVLGIGFPEVFSSFRHYRNRHLNVFVRDGDDSFELIELDHPEPWMTAAFHRDGPRGERLSVLNAPLGWVRSIPSGEPGQWTLVGREAFSFNAMRSYGQDPRALAEDCGFVMISRVGHGLFGNCLMSKAGVLHFHRIATRFDLPASHRLRPSWFDDRVLVLQHIDDQSAQLGFVACTLNAMTAVDTCSYTRFDKRGEFFYGLGRADGGVIVTSNDGNVWQVGEADAAVKRLRVGDGTSLQLYASVRYGSELWWGEYPTGSVVAFDAEGRLQRLPAQLPIDAYRHSAAAEVQTFALYKGDLFAGGWPFGEVYRHRRETGQWALLKRFFSAPPIGPGAVEPFREESGGNEAGQRISDMIAHGDSLYVATASKSGLVVAFPSSVREQKVGQEYGAVYRLRMSGALSLGLPEDDEVTVRVRLTPDTLEVTLNDELLGRTRVAAQQLGCIDNIALRDGTFGALLGPSSEAVIRVNRLACGD